MMLQPEMSNIIAEGQKEMVVRVMPGLKERAGFADEIAPGVDLVLADGKVFGSVGGYIDKVLWNDLGSERDFAKEAAGEQRRIDQRFESDRGKTDQALTRRSGAQSGTEAPAWRQFHGGPIQDLRRGLAFGVKSDFVPAQYR